MPAVAEDGWLEAEKTGCKVWVRNIEPGDQVVWNGPCKEGLAEGRATYVMLSNGRWTWKGSGEFKAGKREGPGSAENADGVKIEGMYRGGVLNGRVIETDPRSGRYVGEYRNGMRNGAGRFTYKNGDSYDGGFKDGLPDGKGTFIGHNDIGAMSTYAGIWKAGCLADGNRMLALMRPPQECKAD